MKKIIILFSILFVGTLNIKSQDIERVIMSMPDDLILPLLEDQKAILSDINNDSVLVAQNILGSPVEKLSASSDFIELKTSKVGITQIKLLPLINDSYIIGVIQTVCDSLVCDSQISFYTTDWKPLDRTSVFPEKDKNWFVKTPEDVNNEAFKNAYLALDMTPIKLQFSPKDQTVEAIYYIKGYLSEDDFKLVKTYLTDEPKIFNWDKSSYR